MDFKTRSKIAGNELAEQASVFRQKYGYLLDKETRLALTIDSLSTNRAKQHSIDSTTAEFDQLRKHYNAERVKYAISHPSLAIAASYLQMQPEDTIKKYFPGLSDQIKSSPVGKSLQQRIAVLATVAPGKAAPLFTARTAEGKTFALETLRGKYVLLDFWGSWCGPCLSGFPQMKARHSNYKDRLTIVGIACRDNKAAWLKAIKEQELPWTQLLDSPDAALANRYGVSAYPTKILIDPQGTLLQITKGEDIGFYKAVDQIVSNAK
ncbi:TlpA family protein disulfide reductase [Spirosoma pomorum]